jgi:hypothetical protein
MMQELLGFDEGVRFVLRIEEGTSLAYGLIEIEIVDGGFSHVLSASH